MTGVDSATVGLELESLRWSWGPEQTILYALGVGAAAGFGRPWIHGSCTHGLVALELVAGLCAGDPGRLREMTMRFRSPVLPLDELTFQAWMTEPETVERRCLVDDRVVVGSGRAWVTQ